MSIQRGDPRRIWLQRYVPIQRAADRAIAVALEEAAQDAETAVREIAGKTGIGAATRRSQLVGGRGAISEILLEFFDRLKGIISDHQIMASKAAVESSLNWDAQILAIIEPNAKKRAVLRASLKQTADSNVQAMITRVLKTKQPLSKQVYGTHADTKSRLNRLINSSIARGDSADQMAKKVREFVSPNTPGGVTYAARRLARTEINNAFHARSIDVNSSKPWVHSFKWNLSRAHKKNPRDKCELYALTSLFAVGSVPGKPHPQCLCYITPEAISLESIIEQSRRGVYDQWLAEHTSQVA